MRIIMGSNLMRGLVIVQVIAILVAILVPALTQAQAKKMNSQNVIRLR